MVVSAPCPGSTARPAAFAGLVTLAILLLHRRYPEAKWLSEEHVRRVAGRGSQRCSRIQLRWRIFRCKPATTQGGRETSSEQSNVPGRHTTGAVHGCHVHYPPAYFENR